MHGWRVLHRCSTHCPLQLLGHLDQIEEQSMEMMMKFSLVEIVKKLIETFLYYLICPYILNVVDRKREVVWACLGVGFKRIIHLGHPVVHFSFHLFS